jgi:hypothetical protein
LKGDRVQEMKKKLQECVKEFENSEQSVIFYEAVQRIFSSYPKNADKLAVALKVAVLNELYRTNILATYKMINHIHTIATGENLDKALALGDYNAVGKIRQGHGIRGKCSVCDRDFYSFATKYCHFSNPVGYPIYDKYVAKAIMHIQKSGYVRFHSQEDLKDPQKFKDVIDHIIRQFGLVDYQQTDRALWVYGMELAGVWK